MIKSKYFALFFCIILFSSWVYADSAYGEEIQREGYIVSRSKVDRTVTLGTLFQDFIVIENLRTEPLSATFSTSGNVMDLLVFDYSGIEVLPKNTSSIYFYIKGTSLGNYSGEIIISGGVSEKIPVSIEVVEDDLSPVFFVQTEPFKKYFKLNEKIRLKVYLNKIKSGEVENLSLFYYLNDSQNQSFFLGEESFNFTNSFYLIKEFNIPPEAEKGEYILQTSAVYNGDSIDSLSYFIIRKAFFNQVLFGFLPVWILFSILGGILFFLLSYILIKRHIKLSKKYRMELDIKKLPKYSKENLSLGKVAETKIKSYLEPEKLKTHTIVAGATGGGKSIAAQVIIEEALMKNIAVIVFDPTAQWSGMLRKCQDKKMLSYYPAFGLKQTDARAFFGNIRQISHAREIIEIEKYIHPGQIQIFAVNKLDPSDMDIFVASVIRQIFKSDPKETPDLKVLQQKYCC